VLSAGGMIELGASDSSSTVFVNNLFQGVYNLFYTSGQLSLYNNLFNGNVALFQRENGAGTWTVKDNSFNSGHVEDDSSAAIVQDYNAYITPDISTTGRLQPDNGHDLVLAPFQYVQGPLGRFYLPEDSPIRGAGSRTASVVPVNPRTRCTITGGCCAGCSMTVCGGCCCAVVFALTAFCC